MALSTCYFGTFTGGPGGGMEMPEHETPSGGPPSTSEVRRATTAAPQSTQTHRCMHAACLLTDCRAAGPNVLQGIYRAKFDPSTGEFSDFKIVAEVQCSPSWFRLHPTLPVLYSTNETFDGSDSHVTAFGLTPTGGL